MAPLELLAPAGDLDKLKIAFRYGADAVFVGGKVFWLRKYAHNFTLQELEEGIAIANRLHKKVYVVLNGFAHPSDMQALHAHLKDLQNLHPHGFIIADMGVLQLAKSLTTVPLHVSTQASITNAHHAKIWKDAGASRVILAREVSISDAKIIKDTVGIEVELFGHGAMCASYSGKCVISNYTSGRDSNRGGCVQTCRHEFRVAGTQAPVGSHVMNAKDLQAITLIDTFIAAGSDSLKIEGRMKSNLYVANTIKTYRQVIDGALSSVEGEAALSQVSHRAFSTGGLVQRPDQSSIQQQFGGYDKSIEFIGTVLHNDPQVGMIVEVKKGFDTQDRIFAKTPTQEALPIDCQVRSLGGDVLVRIHPNSVVQFGYHEQCHPYDLLYTPC